jgi:pSer/pThr/pTyr-binding forkhead associated (FHA) protein
VIDIEGSDVHITDLGSSNGLHVNGERVNRAKLENLDEIGLGLTKLKVMILEDLEAFKRRNDPSRAGKTPSVHLRDIGTMIDDELKQFSKWDISVPGAETISAGDVMAAERAYGLEILEGPDAGRRFRIDKKITTLGRSATDILLKDPDISRLHAEIEVLPDGGVLLRDLGATNGLLVNQARVSTARLKPEDRIKLGSTLIRFVSGKPDP